MLYRGYAHRVLDYARNRGASLEEAEDVVTEVFVVSCRRPGEIPGEPLGWLLGVARKVLANQRRTKGRKTALQYRVAQVSAPLDLCQGETDRWIELHDLRRVLGPALAKLKEKDREVLVLVSWDGLTYKEAAEAMGCSDRAFGLRLLRARQSLLKELGGIRTYKVLEDTAPEGELT
jgi:RNA polymerase sigma-70 factor, ECF subfamily